MAPVLRSLGAAAIAVGQAALTVTENGTYLATVTLDSVPVKLLVDMYTVGLWVRCSALEGPSCADGIKLTTAGYEDGELERYNDYVPRQTKRFKEVSIAGQRFTGFDAYVIYDTLPQVDASIQGILGIPQASPDFRNTDRSSMYVDDQVSTVAIQIGQSSNDSKLSFDTIDQTLLTKKGLTRTVTAYSELDCFSVPFLNGSNGACTSTDDDVVYDPALPYLGLSYTSLDAIERRFLYACSALSSVYGKTGYTCDSTVKLPRLTMQIGSWEVFLDPSEYSTPIAGSSQVKVLTGNIPSMYSSAFVLGTPFLRKYPYVYNRDGSDMFYCIENSTCTKIPATSSPSYSGGGGYGGGYSGGGGSSPSYDIDLDTKRKRSKLALSIGIGVGGVMLLAFCGCVCKGSQSEDAKPDNEVASKTTEDATVALAVGVAVALGDDSDGSSSKGSRETKSKEGTTKTEKDKTKHGHKVTSKTRKESDLSSSSDGDSDLSSSYDSESSEERRRERRRRRRRRRARRRERGLRQQAQEQRQSGATETTVARASTGDDNSSETPYVAASSPKHAVQ